MAGEELGEVKSDVDPRSCMRKQQKPKVRLDSYS